MQDSGLATTGQKTILIILVLQLVLIGFLIYNQFRVEQKLDILAAQKNNSNQTQDLIKPIASDSSRQVSPEPSVSEAQFRTILKQELMAALETQSLSKKAVVNQGAAQPKPPMSPEDLERISLDLDQYLADGDFSALELAKFEKSLADFNKEDRKKILNRMVKAVNQSGVIISQ